MARTYPSEDDYKLAILDRFGGVMVLSQKQFVEITGKSRNTVHKMFPEIVGRRRIPVGMAAKLLAAWESREMAKASLGVL